MPFSWFCASLLFVSACFFDVRPFVNSMSYKRKTSTDRIGSRAGLGELVRQECVVICGRDHRCRDPGSRALEYCIPSVFALVRRMELQQSPAVKFEGASSAPARQAEEGVIETSIPLRLDSLLWSGFHTRIVLALGITWILDGLEVTLAGALSGALKESPALRFTNFDVGFSNSAYLAGAVLGAVIFGWLTDRIGRKKLFFITLALYLTATAATALSWSVASYALFRFLTGAGIGGEYTARNSTIDELVPARYGGWTDLVINGSFWIGAAIGAVSAIVLLDPQRLAVDVGWRLAYLTGACLGLVVFVMRMWIPESPRWLVIHGHPDRANAIVRDIE